MTLPALLLAYLVATPALVLAARRRGVETERLRSIATAAAVGMLIAAGALSALPQALVVPWPGGPSALLGDAALRMTPLSTALVPLPPGLWLLTLGATPRARLDGAGLPRTAVSTLATTLAFMSQSPLVLWVLWTATTWLFLAALPALERRRSRRLAQVYGWSSTLLLGLGVAAVFATAQPLAQDLGLIAIAVAVLMRKAIFPFHAWLPEVFDRGRLGPTALFSAPQLGAYVAAVILIPRASPGLLHAIVALSLVTAVYGAALAAYQHDARRACGYLFVSQSALVLAGLDAPNPAAVAGALTLWISSALAFAGLARCVLAVEARRGRLDLTRHHGGYEQMPLVAVSFLVLGLACAGFPGTLGFVGEELLLSGVVDTFPWLGFTVVATSALTGVVVLRMYFSLFCGRRATGTPMPLLRREALVFGALAAALLIAGVVPGPLVASRLAASRLRSNQPPPARGPEAPAARD